jgi:hypothetical protein
MNAPKFELTQFELRTAADNIAVARDYPDEIVLEYASKTLKRMFPDDETLSSVLTRHHGPLKLDMPTAKNEDGVSFSSIPARRTALQVETSRAPTQKEVSEAKEIPSFYAYLIVSERARSAKHISFWTSVGCAFVALAFMLNAVFITSFTPIVIVPVFIALVLAIESGVIGLLFHLKQHGMQHLLSGESRIPEVSAYVRTRRAKNLVLGVGFMLLVAAFMFFIWSAKGNNISPASFVPGYICLVLSLETGLIGALLHIKQAMALDRVNNVADQLFWRLARTGFLMPA